MGYRSDVGIDPDAGGRGQRARVHTKSSKLDLRGLTDHLGALGALARAACKGRRIAVFHSGDEDLYQPFSEEQARQRGYELRHFSDMAAAVAWLDADDH